MVGHRVESEYTKKVKDSVLTFEEVHGAYDLILHNYGPDKYLGSVHIEVKDTLSDDNARKMCSEFVKSFTEKQLSFFSLQFYVYKEGDNYISNSIKEKTFQNNTDDENIWNPNMQLAKTHSSFYNTGNNFDIL